MSTPVAVMHAVRDMRSRSSSVLPVVIEKKVDTATRGLMIAISEPALISTKFIISIAI